MLNFLFIVLLVFLTYIFFHYLYIKISKSLNAKDRTKNNYVVKNILLSSKHNIDSFDVIVVLTISYFIYYI